MYLNVHRQGRFLSVLRSDHLYSFYEGLLPGSHVKMETCDTLLTFPSLRITICKHMCETNVDLALKKQLRD